MSTPTISKSCALAEVHHNDDFELLDASYMVGNLPDTVVVPHLIGNAPGDVVPASMPLDVGSVTAKPNSAIDHTALCGEMSMRFTTLEERLAESLHVQNQMRQELLSLRGQVTELQQRGEDTAHLHINPSSADAAGGEMQQQINKLRIQLVELRNTVQQLQSRGAPFRCAAATDSVAVERDSGRPAAPMPKNTGIIAQMSRGEMPLVYNYGRSTGPRLMQRPFAATDIPTSLQRFSTMFSGKAQ